MRYSAILLFLLVFGAISSPGQTQVGSKASGQGTSNSAVTKNGRELVSAGTLTSAELTGAIDVRKSKVGDPVVLKTTNAIKQNGQTVVAKGANLIGRITEIQRKTKENG